MQDGIYAQLELITEEAEVAEKKHVSEEHQKKQKIKNYIGWILSTVLTLMCAAMMQAILSDPWVEGDGCKTMSADDMARCGCLATCTPGTVCDGGTGWAALTSETNSSVTVDIEGAIESLLQGRRKIDHPESYCPHFPVETVENEVTSPNAFRDRCCQPNGIENGIKMIQVGLYGRERGERVFRTLQPLFLSIVTATIPFLVKKISMFEQR